MEYFKSPWIRCRQGPLGSPEANGFLPGLTLQNVTGMPYFVTKASWIEFTYHAVRIAMGCYFMAGRGDLGDKLWKRFRYTSQHKKGCPHVVLSQQ